MSKQWTCPECACTTLNYDTHLKIWACSSVVGLPVDDVLGCTYGKNTIQALVGLLASQTQSSTARIIYCDCSSTCKATTHNILCKTFNPPNPSSFTTSPPGFQMPWEIPHDKQVPNTKCGVCDCGGEKTGGAHSSWCSKETK